MYFQKTVFWELVLGPSYFLEHILIVLSYFHLCYFKKYLYKYGEWSKIKQDRSYFLEIFQNTENMFKTFQVPKQTFVLENIRELFLKTVLKNYSLRNDFENIPK